MPYQLSFDKLHFYDSGKSGISIPVTLRIGQSVESLMAKIDTGASHCIFRRIYGEQLGLDIERGYLLQVSTPTGTFTVYGHDVTLVVADFEFDATVYFAADEAFKRDVLGRHGWLEKITIGIRDYHGELYLSGNDS